MNRPEWNIIAYGCIACAFAGATQPALAILLLKQVLAFKNITYNSQIHQALIFGLAMILLGLITILIRFFQFTAFAAAGSKLTYRIRTETFACLLRQEVAYFDLAENNPGAICNRLSSCALSIQELIGTRLGILCETFIMIFFFIICGFMFNIRIALIMLVDFVIIMMIIYIVVKLQKRLHTCSQSLVGQASSLALEVIQNIRTIKQLALERNVFKQFSEISDKLLKIHRNYAIIAASQDAVLWALVAFCVAIIYWRTLLLTQHGQLKPESMIVIFAFSTFFMQALRVTIKIFEGFSISFSDAQVFFDLFDRKTAIDNTSTEGRKLDNFHGKIEFDQVNFVYPTRAQSLVLDNIHLLINPGQHITVAGKSGCGKSTLIQILQRFYDVTGGQVRLDDVDIRELDIQWLRSCIGVVGQEPILFDLTIAENIAYALENVSREDIVNAARKANIDQFIRQLPQGYETKVGIKGICLSGGEKQRLAIARALLRRPKILLLDEATSALDAYNERIVTNVLQQVQQLNSSTTSLNITHRFSTIQANDVVYVMDKGQWVEFGTHNELMSRHGVYYSMASHYASE